MARRRLRARWADVGRPPPTLGPASARGDVRAGLRVPPAARDCVRGLQGPHDRLAARSSCSRCSAPRALGTRSPARARCRLDRGAARRRPVVERRSPTTTCRWRRKDATRSYCRSTKASPGSGPALFGEYDEFAKYFLGDVPIDSAPEARLGLPPSAVRPQRYVDRTRRPSLKTAGRCRRPDVALPRVRAVHRRATLARRSSRPPANFTLLSRGTYYDVWRRTAAPRVLAPSPAWTRRPASGRAHHARRSRAAGPSARALSAGGSPSRRAPAPLVFLAIRDLQRPVRWTGFGNSPRGRS